MSLGIDLDSEGLGRKFEALAKRCRLDAEDEAKALSVYQDMVEAIADCIIARDERAAADPPAMVYIAAYRHRYGVDLSAHASYADAESRLLSIAWQQCMRDADIRAAVDARFGPLVADEPPLEEPFPADAYDPAYQESERSWLDEPFSGSAGRSSCASPIDSQALSVFGGTPEPGCGRDSASAGRSTRSARRKTFCEQLLEEWPELAKGEQLWIVRCEVEGEVDVEAGGEVKFEEQRDSATARNGRAVDETTDTDGGSVSGREGGEENASDGDSDGESDGDSQDDANRGAVAEVDDDT